MAKTSYGTRWISGYMLMADSKWGFDGYPDASSNVGRSYEDRFVCHFHFETLTTYLDLDKYTYFTSYKTTSKMGLASLLEIFHCMEHVCVFV